MKEYTLTQLCMSFKKSKDIVQKQVTIDKLLKHNKLSIVLGLEKAALSSTAFSL